MGYQGEYQKYSPAEIVEIVSRMTDLSLPAVPEGDDLMVVGVRERLNGQLTTTPNAELVAKQRTQSIDQSLEAGMPRTYSTDSVDYTTMLLGDMQEEVKEEIRRQRRNRKPKKL